MRLGFVVFSGFLYGFNGLHVVPHRKQDMRLSDVRLGWRAQIVNPLDAIGESEGSLTELGVHLDGSVSILQRFWQSRQLGIAIRSVVVSPGVIRIPLDTFRVSFNGTSEVSLLEQSVPFLPGLRRLLWIDIRKLLSISLVAFSLTELVENVGSSVLRERFIEVLDGRSQVPGLGVSGSNTPVSLSNELVVRSDLGR